MKTDRKAPAQFVRESEARSIKSGAIRMPGGILPVEAASALNELLANGYSNSKVAVISKALIAAQKSQKK